MLVLTRHVGEQIVIGEDIVIEVVQIRGDKVRLGIIAPVEIPVHRSEIKDALHRQGREFIRRGGTHPDVD
jgi:carbon storage regulator